jgi:hypothetical protein
MKIPHFSLIGLSALSVLVLSSCVDNDYDLSDIDTMARFKTKNLVVPLNLDEITLDQVMDLDEDSEIKTFKNEETGETWYGIKKDGTFDSDPIKVSAFTVNKPTISPSSNTLDLTPLSYVAGMVDQISAFYEIAGQSDPTSFSAESDNVDKSIKSISKLGVNTSFNIKISVSGTGVSSIIPHIKYEGVKIQLPKGLTAEAEEGTYNSSTGIWDLSNETLAPNSSGIASVKLTITAIDAKVANITFTSAPTPDDKGTFVFADEVQLIAGRVNIYDVDPSSLPDQVTFTSAPTLQNIDVNTFTGDVEYDVEDFTIDPIDLADVPDIINQPGTKLLLEKPQLFLEINNPMAKYNVYFESGFELTPERIVRENGVDVKKQKTYEIDANGEGKKTFGTKTTDGSSQKEEGNQFVLAPSTPDDFLKDEYPNPKHVLFTDLKRILLLDEEAEEEEVAETGVGIPTTINVNVKDPKVPRQTVTDFVLGEELAAVKGKYSFYAPLQLSEDSHIAYTDTIDGWNDEDVDNITIDSLTINFDATTEIPFETELTIYPIDTTGEPIAGVKTTTAHLDAKAQNQPVEVTIIGPVTHLDGLLIKAHILNTESDTLSPDMKIYVDNSKATITGHYDKEL